MKSLIGKLTAEELRAMNIQLGERFEDYYEYIGKDLEDEHCIFTRVEPNKDERTAISSYGNSLQIAGASMNNWGNIVINGYWFIGDGNFFSRKIVGYYCPPKPVEEITLEIIIPNPRKPVSSEILLSEFPEGFAEDIKQKVDRDNKRYEQLHAILTQAGQEALATR